MVDFSKVLSVKAEDVKRPPLVPIGTYRARVNKPATFDEIASGKFKVIDFSLLLVEAQPDVSEEELKEYGGLGPSAVMRNRFMFDNSGNDDAETKAKLDRTVFNLKRFLVDSLGLDEATGSLNELIPNATGQECLVSVKWRPDPQNPEIQYAEISRTA